MLDTPIGRIFDLPMGVFLIAESSQIGEVNADVFGRPWRLSVIR